MQYKIGIDGGGTKTEYALFADSRIPILSLTGRGSNHETLPGGMAEAASILADGIGRLLDAANIPMNKISRAAMGLSGMDYPSQIRELTERLRALGIPNPVLCNDGFLIVKAGSPSGFGIGYNAGSGTCAVAIDQSGGMLQFGGFSDFSGDRGNAYWNKFDKKLVVSPELQDKLFVLKHELGHSKDMPGYLEEVIDLKKQRMTVNDGTTLYSHNQKFNKVFADELKEFDEKATISEKVALDYFISQRPFSSSGTFEVLAEANALQSSIQDLPQIAERTVNLERHFPKSLAQAFEYLNQTAKKIKGYVIKDNDSPYLHS